MTLPTISSIPICVNTSNVLTKLRHGWGDGWIVQKHGHGGYNRGLLASLRFFICSFLGGVFMNALEVFSYLVLVFASALVIYF